MKKYSILRSYTIQEVAANKNIEIRVGTWIKTYQTRFIFRLEIEVGVINMDLLTQIDKVRSNIINNELVFSYKLKLFHMWGHKKFHYNTK